MFKLTDTPSAIPGSCYFCGSASRNSYVDTGSSVEFHGAMYICVTCVLEMARLFDLASVEEVKALRVDNECYLQLVEEQNNRLKAAEEVINGYRNLNTSLVVDVNSFGSSHSVGYLAEQEPLPGAEDLGTGEGETSESGDDKGMAELSDDGAVSFALDL